MNQPREIATPCGQPAAPPAPPIEAPADNPGGTTTGRRTPLTVGRPVRGSGGFKTSGVVGGPLR